MKKLLLSLLIGGAAIFAGLFLFLLIIISSEDNLNISDYGDGTLANINLSDEVLGYQSLVEYYCGEYGISDYSVYILAIMQVESGGRSSDVMQCSESLGLPPNTLDTISSIRQGSYYFSSLLNTANMYGCDINTVIQAYNYGGAFIPYVANNGGLYTFDLASSFASMKAGGVTVAYSNTVAVSVNGGWRYAYGNMFYVKLVNQYITYGASSSGFIWPTAASNRVTSVYGNRRHPISGVNKMHNGIDIGAALGTDILAAASGTVTFSGWKGGYGNCIIIDHGGGFKTLYGHMSRLIAQVGDRLSQGQVIGLVGSTGNSTGPHLHFEVYYNDSRTDPLSYFDESQYIYA